MSVDSLPENPAEVEGITRREFLKKGRVALGALLLGAKIGSEKLTASVQEHPEEILADAIVMTMKELGTERGDQYLRLAARAADIKARQVILNDSRLVDQPEERKALVKPNPDFRNPTEILSEAIEMYEQETGKKPVWKPLIPTEDQLDAEIFITNTKEKIRRIYGDRSNPVDFEAFVWFMAATVEETAKMMPNRKFSVLIRDLIVRSGEDIDNLDDLGFFLQASGMVREVLRKGGVEEQYSQASWWSLPQIERDKTLKGLSNVLASVYSQVEASIFQETPVSISRLINFFLKRNNGELSPSLWDTTIFLKLLSRNDFTTGFYRAKNPEYHPGLVKRTCCFLDEYSLSGNWRMLENLAQNKVLSYEDDNKELSPINRTGAAYHVLNIIAFLSVLPLEVCRIIGTGEIINGIGAIKDQGYEKTAIDLQATANLREMNRILQGFGESQTE